MLLSISVTPISLWAHPAYVRIRAAPPIDAILSTCAGISTCLPYISVMILVSVSPGVGERLSEASVAGGIFLSSAFWFCAQPTNVTVKIMIKISQKALFTVYTPYCRKSNLTSPCCRAQSSPGIPFSRPGGEFCVPVPLHRSFHILPLKKFWLFQAAQRRALQL